MTQEDKELLLRDLCSRLPYGVRCEVTKRNIDGEMLFTRNGLGALELTIDNVKELVTNNMYEIKPYLFPLSSMTEEQKRELLELTGYEPRCEKSCGFDSWGFYVNIVGEYKYKDGKKSIILYPDDIGINWCNKNHFDYRGLIPMGSAIDATGLNIY